MREPKALYIEPYGFWVYYLISDQKTCEKILKERYKYVPDPPITGTGIALPLERDGSNVNDGYFIWVHKDAGYEVKVHEVFHATKYIMFHCGIDLTNSSNEAYAYLIAHIFKKLIRGDDDGKSSKQIKRKRK
jgi:hypothetical protein